MKLANCRLLIGLILFGLFISISAPAQDEARAAWIVTNFDITVANPGADRVLNAKAIITARNVGAGAGLTLSVRISPKAEIKSISLGNVVATYLSRPDPHVDAQRITINLPAPVPANGTVSATIDYRLPIADNSGIASITPDDSQFLPQSMWYPTVNNEYAVRGDA